MRAFLVATLLAGWLITVHPSRPAWAAPPVALSAVQGPTGDRIDQAAISLPPTSGYSQTVEVASGLVGWLVSRAPISADREEQETREAYAALRRTWRVSPAPPEVAALFERLVQTLPERFRPKETRFQVEVLQLDKLDGFTIGGGHVFVSQRLIAAATADWKQAEPVLAFAMAGQLGHIAREHCRDRYRLLVMREELAKENAGISRAKLGQRLRKDVEMRGELPVFHYSPAEAYTADLFALHLCRNAGIDTAAALDFLRWKSALADRNLLALRGTSHRKPADDLVRQRDDDLAPRPHPLQRLRRLLLEQMGTFPGKHNYGLHVYESKREKFIAAEPAAATGQRAVVLIHGMESGLDALLPLAGRIAAEPGDQPAVLLGFSWPNDTSLSRVGELLHTEVERVLADAEHVDFVCHSAGGLIFRYHVECRGGKFHRAVLLGTPHLGSSLAGWHPLAELSQFAGGLSLGLGGAIGDVFHDGQGQIGYDLQPDSLFLSYLASHHRRGHAERYHMVRGRVARTGLLLTAGLAIARRSLREQAEKIESPYLQELTAHFVENLQVPPEVSDGDLAVTTESATLAGAASVETVYIAHSALLTEADVMDQVVKLIAAD